MPRSADELRQEGRAWLAAAAGRLMLPRTLYLVPGITNEDALMWATVEAEGRRAFRNWDAYARPVKFESVSPNQTFEDQGIYFESIVASTYPADGLHLVGDYDILSYSMGGLDAAFALERAAESSSAATPRMRRSFNFITLDAPFDGVPNWRLRKTFSDMIGRPDRQSQCDALAPHSPELTRLGARRDLLGAACERVTCYSAGGDSAVQVPWSSSDLFADMGSAAPWGPRPSYRHYIVPGASHSGESAIYDNPYVIASVFGVLIS